MIRLTRMTDYSIVLLTYCARHAERPIHTTRDLSVETGLPLPTVGKILKLLAKNDLMESHRGVKGGYGLSRRPEKISLYDIVNAMEGSVALTECTHEAPSRCNLARVCPVSCHWQLINDAVKKALETVTLADMMRREAEPLLTVSHHVHGVVPGKAN